MTSFGALFKVMSRGRFRIMNWLIVGDFALVIATMMWAFATDGIQAGDIFWTTVAWSILAFILAFILLAIQTERVYTRDTYRLLPLGETKLYLTDLAASLIMFIYFGVIQLVMYAVAEAIDNRYLMKFFGEPSITTGQAIKGVVGFVILGLAFVILCWTTVSLVHLVISATNNFLPNTSRRLINFILYVVVIFLVVRITAFLFHEFNNVGQLIAGGGTTQLLINIVGVLVVAAVEAILNILILKKWVETIPN
ncbi:ABC transporter permease [Levilactobacillus hammesii]|uniref:ABC transporter permease n=1 Tax=Levilactobacillus hammesii DSM 16381 TaxID=1423753 RepID=A0A0R1UKY2_9LACO|nr:hypothetical protein [Levilactobacillus hammesii]KRL93897.1 ABC transporter permease [Levilactobacillus hammesii DSM 16381]